MVGGHLPKKIYVFLIMMKYDDLYFASRYNFFTDSVEWYFLPKTEIKVFLKKMDIRGFGWRPSIFINDLIHVTDKLNFIMYVDDTTIYFSSEEFDPATRKEILILNWRKLTYR